MQLSKLTVDFGAYYITIPEYKSTLNKAKQYILWIKLRFYIHKN